MSFQLKLLTLFLVGFALQVQGQVYFKKGAPFVQLANGGLVSGIVKFSRDGRPYNSFVGIPYATVEERFQEPTPITTPSWQGVLSATKPGPICPQMPFGTIGPDTESSGDENCLNLNVFIPMNNTGTGKKGYPVMVWIHGGGFMAGDSVSYQPQYIMEEDVVLVTFNYRVGVFGFLSTGDNVIPGNNGMKDMVVALKWVQKNIKAFGGDPNSITIFGESAGGSAVHYLMLSPITKGLFHKAISQSGSALNLWAYNPNPKETAVELATYLNCQTTASEPSGITSEEILACLKGVTTGELNRAQNTFKLSWPADLRPFYFQPVTEPSDPVSSLTPFLSEPPISILIRNDSVLPDIPWMVGATEDEGAAMYAGFILSSPEFLEQANSDWENVASTSFGYRTYGTQEVQAQVSQKLKQFYFGDKQISHETRIGLRNLMSDEMILNGVYKAAIATASRGKKPEVYFYQYAYQGPFSLGGKMFGVTGEEAEKVGHGDDLLHLFDISAWFPGTGDIIKPDTPDEQFSKNLVRLWASFATHGEPKYTWGNATFKRWKELSKKQIDGVYPLTWFRIQENPVSYEIDQSVKDRMNFWDEIWDQYFTPAIIAHAPSSSTQSSEPEVAETKTEFLVAGQVYFKKGAPFVQLANGGLVSGIVKFSRDGRPYNSFVGIPYASVEERFQEPTPITTPPWQGVLSATKHGPICPQTPFRNSGTESIGDESSCLNLNVFIPMNNTGTGKKGYPVMVWVHGGGFMVGDGGSYKPQFIMDADVVLVTFNYRVGVYGFLSTGDNVVPGNNGMKDMVIALKWVQDNIKAFGGDPNSVTIFGESAGGAAVHYLMLSPTTKGLFHKAISQSGSALNQFAYNPNPKKTAVELATHLKCQTTSPEPSEITSEEILTCLKGISTEELNRAQNTFKQSWPLDLRPFYFHPVTEPTDPVSSLTPFLPEPPISILTRNDSVLPNIPWMVGATEDEGAAMFAGLVLHIPELLEQINSDWENVASSSFDYRKYSTPEEQAQISKKLKQFYFGDKQISQETRVALRNMMSDEMILNGVYKAAILAASRGKKPEVYFYQYAYQGPFSITAKLTGITGEEAEKVGHGDDLLHLFEISEAFPGTEDAIKPDTPDEQFSKNLVRLWASFATYGEPKYTWGNATFRKWKALSKKQIDGVYPLTWFRIQENPVTFEIDQSVKDRMKFWDELWEQYFTPAVIAHAPSFTTQNLEPEVVKDKIEL